MQIEILSVGDDLYGAIESSIHTLNAIQDEFSYRTAPEALRGWSTSFVREKYTTDELFDHLREYRKRREGGNSLHLLAFVSRHLDGKLGNIFGAPRESEKAAVATTHEYQRYARDVKRFCSYYLVRYSLSFCSFAVKSHERDTDKDCYFHMKMRKSDIALSMNSGRLCDDCRRQLNLSAGQSTAFKAMADYIAGRYPHALVMKGGGIKGLAYAGALQELEQHFTFDVYAGTSAGAVAAVLLAARLTPTELRTTLQETSFDRFLDRVWWWPLNLLRGGLHSGDAFRKWVTEQLQARIKKTGNIQLVDLPDRAIVYACSPGLGTVVFDSKGKRKETDASFAVRRSMSIPFFFVPEQFEGYSIYDGGLRHNFPVSRFVADHPTKPFVALYLQSARTPKKRLVKLLELYDVWMEADEREVVDRFADGVAVIDPTPISTTDFSLTPIEKELLINAGRLAALRLVQQRNMEDAASDSEISSLTAKVEALRTQATTHRRWTFVWNILLFMVVIGILIGYLMK